jgi:hypothetical protein
MLMLREGSIERAREGLVRVSKSNPYTEREICLLQTLEGASDVLKAACMAFHGFGQEAWAKEMAVQHASLELAIRLATGSDFHS